MDVGVFYAWDFLMVLIISLCYWGCPPRFIARKEEYVKYFLSSFTLYFLVFLVVKNICDDVSFTHWLWWTLLCPYLFITHLLYPFKERKRNQHLSFFLFFAALYSLGVNMLILIGFMGSHM